jgi:NADPH:quinone reductase-like Zn-dependent oxidoreductase
MLTDELRCLGLPAAWKTRTTRTTEPVRVPLGLDPAEAVRLVLNYTTAYQLLHRIASLRSGQSVLIHGAAGGVGTAALQLGSLAGLKMFGTASKAKHHLVVALGGIPIDYRTEDFGRRAAGVDAVLDPIGGRKRAAIVSRPW